MDSATAPATTSFESNSGGATPVYDPGGWPADLGVSVDLEVQPSSRPPIRSPASVLPIRDLPRDLMGALPRTRWEPYSATHLVTGLPFANSTGDFKMDHYSSTSSTN